MAGTYKTPLQSRALTTEQKFLDALNDLLQHKSLGLVTIDEIAAKAGLTRSAFLKRFGTKKQALIVLYGRYCDKLVVAMAAVAQDIPSFSDSHQACLRICSDAQELQTAYFSVNRAMLELFMEDLTIHPQTKALFLQCCDLMRQIQKVQVRSGTDVGAYSAAQLIFTLTSNHVLKAMPGLPRDRQTRQRLMADIVSRALLI
jgi:AcrR family transcriptional regulator